MPRSLGSLPAGKVVFALLYFAGLTLRLQAQPTFGAGMILGQVSTYNVSEASGLVASRQNPGVLWTHNDSGFPGTVFALSTNGALLGQWTVPDASPGNYEDIAIGPGPKPGFQYLYLGDIGDNYLVRPSIRVFRFPEPAAYGYQSNFVVYGYVPESQDIELVYPDGPHDAEGMLVDPVSGDLFLFTKLTNSAGVYRATRAQLDSGDTVTLTFLREISFRRVSAADISADGSMIAVRRSGSGLLWTRAAGQSVDQALAGSGISIPMIGQPTEPNGEALAFAANGSGYYTLSEGYGQPIYFFPRTDPLPPVARVLLPAGADWRYDDWGDPFGDDWFTPQFDDEFYNSGTAPLGYGSGEATTIDYGFSDAKYITTYFRTRFGVSSVAGLSNVTLRICFNDGFAAYLNGVEIARVNLNPGATLDTLANSASDGLRQTWRSFPVKASLVHTGENVLAVEVHRADSVGPSLNFDAQLVEARVELPPRFDGLPVVTNGTVTLRIAGPAGQTVQIQRCSDFQNWMSAGAVLLTNGTGMLTQPASGAMSFYRIAP